MSTGALSEEDVEGFRTGRIVDPLVSQVAALAAAFGIPPSYLLDRGKDPSVLDEEVLEALADERAGAILRESARLPQRENVRRIPSTGGPPVVLGALALLGMALIVGRGVFKR